MPNLKSNVLFDQLPHIVINHPKTDPDHWAIMICLFKILKDFDSTLYTNETISKNSRVSVRTVERKLPQLIDWLFIKKEGYGYNRRLYLGLAFDIDQIKYNSANKAKPSNKVGTKVEQHRHSGGASRHRGETSRLSGGHSNNVLLKDITKDIFPSSTSTPKHPPYTENEDELVRKYKHGLKYPRFRLEGNELIKAKALYDRHN